MENILLQINDFASSILGKNFVDLSELGKVSRMQSVVPGADSESLAKLGTKPVVCKVCTLLVSFCTANTANTLRTRVAFFSILCFLAANSFIKI